MSDELQDTKKKQPAKKARQAAQGAVLKTAAVATDGTEIQVESFPPKSAALAALFQSAYGFSIEDAQQIVAEREKDPSLHPYDLYTRAKAMLEGWKAAPVAVSTRPGWKRSRGH